MRVQFIYLFVLSILLVLFGLYTAAIYASGWNLRPKYQEAAIRGHLIFQKYNCQACHQLYGLGGYLGPDLTSEYRMPGRSETFIWAMIQSGTKSMPAFHLSKEEINDLMAFFKMLSSQTGADPRDFDVQPNGMIKHQQHESNP